MKKIRWLVGAALLVLVPLVADAIKFESTEVRDPITNDRVKVNIATSAGTYVRHWPSKSDQVFWPYTDANYLWFNPKSGYVAFGGDFENIEATRRDGLRAWLKANFNRNALPQSRVELLHWAERVYSARKMNDDFWCHFYRLMAYETRANRDESLAYVRKAIPLLKERLNAATKSEQRMETLYLLSEYNRRLGNKTDASAYMTQLESLEVDGKLSDYKRYLLEIAKEQRDQPGR